MAPSRRSNRTLLIILAITGLVLSCCLLAIVGGIGGKQTPTPTAVARVEATVTRAPEASRTEPPTATGTLSPTETSTPTRTTTPEPTATRSPTPEPSPTLAPAAGVLQVHFIDVGQGDAILIQSPDGKMVLIDGGEPGAGALQYLQSHGIQRLDLMVATHPHSDHIGGLADILRAMPVGQVATNGQPHTTMAYERFLDAIAAAKAPYNEVKRGDKLQVGSLVFQVLHPATNTSEDLNDNSVVLRLDYGRVPFLFTGDVQAAGEGDMLVAGQPVDVAVLKVAHHGSRSSSSVTFLEKVSPILAVYSCSRDNNYGHPSGETLANLAAAGADVHGTDREGTVVIATDGTKLDLASSSVATRAPPTVTAAPAATQPAVGLALDVVSLTSPVARGAYATVAVKTAPGASCTITVYYKSGPSEAAGLVPKAADAEGNVSWTWKVGTRTTPGTWRIVVTASAGGSQVSRQVPFEVTG